MSNLRNSRVSVSKLGVRGPSFTSCSDHLIKLIRSTWLHAYEPFSGHYDGGLGDRGGNKTP